MAASVAGSLLIVRLSGTVDPVVATYRITFAPVDARLRGRHVACERFEGLTDFLRKAGVPTFEVERAWRTLARRRFYSVPRVALTVDQIETLGL